MADHNVEFVGMDLSREESPDATTVLKFRRLLEEHDLTKLLFEEIKGPSTGAPEDADPRNRRVVRLTAVSHTDRFGHVLIDPANSGPTANAITLIAWDAADALPFPLCLSSVSDADAIL